MEWIYVISNKFLCIIWNFAFSMPTSFVIKDRFLFIKKNNWRRLWLIAKVKFFTNSNLFIRNDEEVLERKFPTWIFIICTCSLLFVFVNSVWIKHTFLRIIQRPKLFIFRYIYKIVQFKYLKLLTITTF